VAPEISVVIPTLDREARLAFALDALAEQTLGRERFEVIVVRGAERENGAARAPDGLTVRFLTLPGSRGAAAQRNVGWRSAEAPLVAFTDDDCRPAPDWLERLLESAGERREAFVQGRTEPDPAERRLLYGYARSMEVVGASDWHETCNIAYPRALLERLGGFDEGFEGVWGEDTDLGLRALDAGAEHVYSDRALVWHAVLPRSLRAALRETSRYEAIPLLLKRYPAQRDAIHRRWFLRPTHALVPLALFGALAPRVPVALRVAAIVPYLRWHLRHELGANGASPRTLARFALQLPAVAAIETLEVVATARGAVKHRAPVL
jgi:glycosyltransferase involved in cell wall biosynthesis